MYSIFHYSVAIYKFFFYFCILSILLIGFCQSLKIFGYHFNFDFLKKKTSSTLFNTLKKRKVVIDESLLYIAINIKYIMQYSIEFGSRPRKNRHSV